MKDYQKTFKQIRVIEDGSGGLLELELIERIGQDRKSKILNNFTGHLAKTDIRTVDDILTSLNKLLPNPVADEIVIGMITSGIILSSSLARIRGSKFNYSTSGKFEGYQDAFSFNESHRADKVHYFYGLKPGDKVIFVEDEVTSGIGLILATNALVNYGVEVLSLCTVLETVNFNARERIKDETGIDLISLTKIELVQ